MKEILIKILEYMFEDIQDRHRHPNKGNGINLLECFVANGKVLPKGHGELKDTNEILAKTHAMQKDLESDNDRVWKINKPKYKALAYANRFIIDAPVLVKEDKEG